MKKITLTLQSCLKTSKRNFGLSKLLLFNFLLFSMSAVAQGPGCPNVDAGGELSIGCGEDCIELNASFLDTGTTSQYEVSSIPYDTPFPFSDLENRVSVNIDDVWSNVIDLPFEFCFFDEVYDEVIIGSNGIISFNTGPAGGRCEYALGEREALPHPSVHKNAIMLYHDINPLYGVNEIGWELFGEAPCRTLVVSFFDVPYYHSSSSYRNNDATSTFQMVLYETTNAIDFFVQSKPNPHDYLPSPINGGRALLGIQNATGTQGYTPPGRNTSVWSATEEAWRFTPSGESNVEFVWLDADGNEIGDTPNITVCPANDSTTYTAKATYTNCNGDEIIVTDEVTVTKTNTFSVDLGDDQMLCDANNYTITARLTDANPADVSFLWNTGATTQSITVTETGTYTVEVTLDDCTLTRSVEIQFNDTPNIDLGEDMNVCFDEAIILDATPQNYPDPSGLDYEWTLNGTIIAGATASTLEVTEAGTYGVSVVAGSCNATATIDVNLGSFTVDLGADIETCFEDPIVLDATPQGQNADGATFEWTLDGAIIDGATSATLEVTAVGLYGVTVSLGQCIETATIAVNPGQGLEVSLGGDIKLCPNEPYTLTASNNEEDVTYQWLVNNTEIPGATGQTYDVVIEEGTMGTQTYTVIISSGACTGTDSIDAELYSSGKCVISQGISPNGDGFNDNLDLSFLNDRTGIKKLQIFNRLGTSVYEQVNYTNQWEGQTNDGNELPTGTYFYVIDLDGNDSVYGQQATGWIYLNRKP